MRSGRGALHEEMWETRSDRPTKVELFQIWVNLPATMKMSPPAIRYLGDAWHAPYDEASVVDANGLVARVRTLGTPQLERASVGDGEVLKPRPAVSVQHVGLEAGGSYTTAVPREHTALLYVRKGSVLVNGQLLGEVRAGSTCVFQRDGECVHLVAAGDAAADALLLSGAPMNEPVALGGPIVMNTEAELQRAYAELRAGTFLDHA